MMCSPCDNPREPLHSAAARPRGLAARDVLTAVCLALAGCATPVATVPPVPGEAPPRSVAERARDDYEAQLRTQAEAAMAERRWNDAALGWELLATVRRDDPLVAERLAESRQRNRAEVAALEARADQAGRRGNVDVANQIWWTVLALDPSNAAATAALRKQEGDANRKTFLGRHAGSTLTRRAIADAEAMPAASKRPGAALRDEDDDGPPVAAAPARANASRKAAGPRPAATVGSKPPPGASVVTAASPAASAAAPKQAAGDSARRDAL